jgi:mycothiol synthase
VASVEYRHPSKADIEAINDVINRSGKELPLHRDETVAETREFTFEEDDYDPEGFLLAIIGSAVVGYGGSHVNDHRVKAGKNDAWITVEVVPEHRGEGIEQNLMRFGLDYIKSRNMVLAHRSCFGTEGWRHDVSVEFGFEDARHFFLMEWKEKVAPVPIQPPAGILLEHAKFKDASDETVIAFAKAMNEAFADHYNFVPRPSEKFLKWRETDENITRLSWAKEGAKVVGVCMCAESALFNKENNIKVGWANILGVVQSHRKRGIGRALLSEGMRWIFDRRMDTIYLGMDAENRNALELYTSLGFKVHTESITYDVTLD